MSELFYGEIEEFTWDRFTKTPSMTRIELRDHLCANEGFVPKKRGLKIHSSLFTVVKDDPNVSMMIQNAPQFIKEGF